MDTPDPKTGLSRRQKDVVVESWGKVAADWKQHGPDFFIRLFKAYPSVFAYFKSLHGMDFDTMKEHAKLKAHTINFKLGLRSFVENLDDPDTLVILIQKNTANHFRRGIRTPEFQDAFKLFLDFLDDVLKIDDFTKDAWKKTLEVVATIIDGHIKELEQENINGD